MTQYELRSVNSSYRLDASSVADSFGLSHLIVMIEPSSLSTLVVLCIRYGNSFFVVIAFIEDSGREDTQL